MSGESDLEVNTEGQPLLKEGTLAPRLPARPNADLKVQLFRRIIAEESLLRLDVVEELARVLCSTLDIQRIFGLLAERLPQLVEHSHLCLALYSGQYDGYVIEYSVVQDDSVPLAAGTVISPPQCGLRAPSDFTRPLYEADISQDPGACPVSWVAHGIRSRVFVPIVIDSSCLGALLLTGQDANAFVREEIEFLESVTRYLAIALRNAMLYEQSQRALDQLRATQHQLIQVEKQRVIGEMAAGIAHDLNNSLGGVVGLAELAALQISDPGLLDLLSKLKESALDAAETVRRINLFGRQKPGPEEYLAADLRRIAEGTIILTRYKWQNLAQLEGRSIRTETLFEDPAPVLGKPNELREVVTNLIMNAVDAMPQGGTVTLRTFREGDRACLSIEDTGVGIAAADLERIFDQHFTTKGEAGSGVGLSISRDIARAHGGDLRISSVPGEGSQFTLQLPLYDGSRQFPEPGVTKPAPSAGGVSLDVLVVEDDPNVQEIVALLLERDGHRVTRASTGREGIEAFGRSHFDLVLTDFALPGGTGDLVIQQIQRQSPKTPTVLMTGWKGSVDESAAASWGVMRVLYKPLSMEDLRSVVADAVSMGRD